jgi:phage tail-like protein
MDETTAVFKIAGPNIENDTFTVGAAGVRAGRAGDNELVLASSEISRHHMRFEWIGGEIAVRDLNSSNGIWFNDERIRPDVPQVLKVGNLIRVGPFTITLERIDVPTKKRGKSQPDATLEDLPAASTPIAVETPPAEIYVPKTAPLTPEPAPPAHEPEPVAEEVVMTKPPAAEPEPVAEEAIMTKPPAAVPEPVAEEVIMTTPPVAESKPETTGKKAKPAKDDDEPKAKAAPAEPPPADAQSFIFTPLTLDDDAPAPAKDGEKPAKQKQPAAESKEDKDEPKADGKKKAEPEAVEPQLVAPPVEKPKEKEPAKIDADDPYHRMPVMGGDGASLSPQDPLPPIPSSNGAVYPIGIPHDSSTWIKYLPGIYLDDDFVGRFLLIFEAMMSPSIWIIDNLDLYFSPSMAPLEWVRWLASWFDILIVPELPEDRQRAILSQVGWLAQRRGTKAGLERLLELYFGVRPEIIEEPAHFTVRLPLSESKVRIPNEVIDRLILTHKPAFASYTLEIT